MGDRSAYLAPGGYSAGNSTPGGYVSSNTGGNKGNYSYSREDYAWNLPKESSGSGGSSSNNSGGSGGSSNQATQQGKADVSCYLAPK